MEVKLESNKGNLLDTAKVKNQDVVVVSSQTKQAVQDVVFGSVCGFPSLVFTVYIISDMKEY